MLDNLIDWDAAVESLVEFLEVIAFLASGQSEKQSPFSPGKSCVGILPNKREDDFTRVDPKNKINRIGQERSQYLAGLQPYKRKIVFEPVRLLAYLLLGGR